MTVDMFAGLARHLLTFVGGAAVAKGWVDETSANALVGAAMTIVGAGWSLWQKHQP